MWVCMNDGFISAVNDRNDDSMLWIRARKKEHLESVFPDYEIKTTFDSDYRYRVHCSKQNFADIIVNRINDIGYDNFKNSVKDKKLKHLYGSFWGLHYQYQEYN